jgi:hypothetical protein
VRTIIVETANRFARDLMVQEVGFAIPRNLGITLIAADSPASFLDDGPTSKLIRQILGAVAEFDKAMTVAKLKALATACDAVPASVRAASPMPSAVNEVPRWSRWRRRSRTAAAGCRFATLQRSLLCKGYTAPSRNHYSASAIASMLG